MREPGLISRRYVVTDTDGKVVVNEVWDLTAPGCPVPMCRDLLMGGLGGPVDPRNWRRQIKMSQEEYRRGLRVTLDTTRE